MEFHKRQPIVTDCLLPDAQNAFAHLLNVIQAGNSLAEIIREYIYKDASAGSYTGIT